MANLYPQCMFNEFKSLVFEHTPLPGTSHIRESPNFIDYEKRGEHSKMKIVMCLRMVGILWWSLSSIGKVF
jgi:hypothetical protein